MSFRDIIIGCTYRSGVVLKDIKPVNHLDKLAKHLNSKGAITVSLTKCMHPNRLNDYCSSACPKMGVEHDRR